MLRYRPLALFLARRFAGRGEELQDLEQVALTGLIKAVDRFDPSFGAKLSSFASATIVGELKRHLRDKSWALSIPRRAKEAALAVDRAIRDLSQELGRSPTVDEIARCTGLNESEVLEGLAGSGAHSTTSLDAPLGEDGATLAEMIGGEDENLLMTDEWVAVQDAIRQLPDRLQKVVYLRFFKEMSQSQIAQEIDVSQMHVSRLLAEAIKQLRSEIGD